MEHLPSILQLAAITLAVFVAAAFGIALAGPVLGALIGCAALAVALFVVGLALERR